MLITKKTPIYIYGYGTRGIRVCSRLQEQGLCVSGFIDQNAARYVDQIQNLPIYGLDKINDVGIDFTQTIVFVAVTNVFEHEVIAEELNKRGFKFIICKLFQNDTVAVRCSEIYEIVVDVLGENLTIEHLNIPMFELVEKINVFMEEDKDIVITAVPVDLLFGLTRELYYESLKDKSTNLLDKITDKSILYFNISKGLFLAFESKLDETVFTRYIQIYIENRMAQTFDDVNKETVDEDEFRKHLNDRYAVYQKMEKIFSESLQFFYSNPPSVIWNSKGYFNIEDGNNRACFLLGKGVYEIPCRMKKKDYKAWINSYEKIGNVKKALNSYSRKRMPISHPHFRESMAPYYRWAYQKLQYICEWLWGMNIDTMHIKVLVINSEDDLCGRHMARMGGDVTIVESPDLSRFHKVVDELLYIDGIQYVDSLDEVLDETYDLVLFTQDHIKEVTQNIRLKYVRGIGDVCKKIMSCDDWAVDLDKTYAIIAEQLCGSNIHSLICMEGNV